MATNSMSSPTCINCQVLLCLVVVWVVGVVGGFVSHNRVKETRQQQQ